ncbi:MAG: GIY-YIG nuclease family protein [Thermodesulfobacteriota bacterium]
MQADCPTNGVYQIKNRANGKVFIGSDKNLPGKFNSHRFQLKQGSHMNRALQEDYKNFGEEKFSFDVLDYLEPKEDPKYDYAADLALHEEMWVEKLQPFGEQGYNKRKGADRQ